MSRAKKRIEVSSIRDTLSRRLRTALDFNNVVYLDELSRFTQREFSCMPNFGRKTNNELVFLAETHKIKLTGWVYIKNSTDMAIVNMRRVNEPS
jgi:DNA-directed RNA polymerase alpha subunit